jgi:hypothetical protein
MYCKHCGNKLKDNTKFCTGCGKLVEKKDNEVASSSNVTDKQTGKPQEVEDSSTAIFITVFVIVLAIVGLILWASLSSSSTENQNDQNVVGSSTSSQNTPTGQSYYLKNGAYSVFFPEEPTLSTIQQDFGNGNNNVLSYIYDFTAIDKSVELQAIYSVSALANVNTSSDDSLKNEVIYGGNKNGFKVISSSITSYSNFPAITYTLYNQAGNIYYKAIDIAKGNDIYTLDYQYTAGQENKSLENSFFNSLTFSSLTQTTPTSAFNSNTSNGQQAVQSSVAANNSSITESLSPSLINKIESAVVEINCWSGPNATTLGTEGSGEAFSSKVLNGAVVITSNFHVYEEAYTGTQPPTCYATFPEPPDFSFNANYGDYQIKLIAYKYNPDTYQDEALFVLGAPYTATSTLNEIPLLTDLPLSGLDSDCTNVSVGDKLTIFGYPASGNALGISETVTQGIVSGILPGPIYKTDAPIDHGNSGGIAIRDSDSCILGIPTLGVSGLTAGIGYIQSTYLLNQPTTD